MAVNMTIEDIIRNTLQEDLGKGDITTKATVPQSQKGVARIISKQSGVIAGTNIARQVFKEMDSDLTIKLDFSDGDKVEENETIIIAEGKIRSILQAERVALNFLAHLSGVATITAEYVDLVSDTNAKITDTRKTSPLLRKMEKEAVLAGGGVNHRIGLYDMVLLKENHIHAAGGIRNAVRQSLDYLAENELDVSVEVETRNIDEVREALTTDVNRIMLDNMTIDEIKEAVALINHQVEVEVSGGVNLNNVREIALCGPDFISVGAITHSVKAFDFSLLLNE
jgi:nicotinate-nucleotide pyrophosphorylase (carboxylating)